MTGVLLPLCVRSEALVYNFTNVISGSPGPAGPAPWVRAVFEDVSTDTVRLTVSNLGLTGLESERYLFFNLDPSLAPASLTFTLIGQGGSFNLPSIEQGANAYKADGDGWFDIQLAFSEGNQSERFVAGQSLVYDISGIPGLTAAAFGWLSYDGGGEGQFYAAAHIQQIGAGLDSAWIGADRVTPVPEPAANLLWLLAAATVFSLRLPQHRAKAARASLGRPPWPAR